MLRSAKLLLVLALCAACSPRAGSADTTEIELIFKTGTRGCVNLMKGDSSAEMRLQEASWTKKRLPYGPSMTPIGYHHGAAELLYMVSQPRRKDAPKDQMFITCHVVSFVDAKPEALKAMQSANTEAQLPKMEPSGFAGKSGNISGVISYSAVENPSKYLVTAEFSGWKTKR